MAGKRCESVPADGIVTALLSRFGTESWDRKSEMRSSVLEFLAFSSNIAGGPKEWRTRATDLRQDLQSIPADQIRQMVLALLRRSLDAFCGMSAVFWRPHWYLIAGLLGR